MAILPADLFLSPDLSEEDARAYLELVGFQDSAAADEHLQALADELPVREVLGDLAESLLEALKRTPDPDAALVGFTRYVSVRQPRTAFLRYLIDDPRALGVLVDVMGTSPSLTEILIRNPEYLHWLTGQIDRSAPDVVDLAEEVEGFIGDAESGGETAPRVEALKRFRRREFLRIATRDILGHESLASAVEQISDLADVATRQALALATRKVLTATDRDRLPGRFAVIGMGKLGGRELNYSSDIDLMFVYNPEDEDDQRAHELFLKVARTLFTLMTEFTDEGYLYRVDLRLRPMGRQGNIAYSLRQHVQYYETWGDTFERFALIKARPIAGDPELGAQFVERVRSFVYRRYLDHAALEEIFRYKERSVKARDVDRDVKVGRGGIREIELFTQALLLTYGAEQPRLREANTMAALHALCEVGLIGEDVRDQLTWAYEFLRTVEHRLQIVQQLQTHELSQSDAELEICAKRLGFRDAASLQQELQTQRDRVHGLYQLVFDRRQGTTDFESRQFFRILADDIPEAEALTFLSGYGLADPARALDVVRSLEQATSLAPSRSMARNTLANLLPALLERAETYASPDQVLVRFERVAEGSGAAASFCQSLLESPALRTLFISTLDLGDLPVMRLVKYPELLDSLLYTLPRLEELGVRYADALGAVAVHDHVRDHIRRVKAIEEFKVLVESVSDGSLTELQQRLSLLADCCLRQAATWAAPRDGRLPEWIIVALGKLGGRELTVHSDLDLVVIYDGPADDSATFMEMQRFVKEMVRCLEEPTGEGVAYRVDTRLRPEGRKGALALPLEKFVQYLDARAEPWERLAWTRGRVVVGSEMLATAVERIVADFVYGPWDPTLPAVMTRIRQRMERELGDTTGALLEFKVGRGGLADIDFLLQMIQIREGRERPEFRMPGTRGLLEAFPGTPLLSATDVGTLRHAHGFLRSLETFARIELDTAVSAVAADPEKLDTLGRRFQLPSPAGQALLDVYRDTTEPVRQLYEAVLDRF